jgi:MYXO-CTERM domain-containing protein
MYEQYFLRIVVRLSAGLLLVGCSLEGEPAGSRTERASVGAARVRAEVALDQAVPSPVPGHWPVAAFDGTQYLVVWQDLRADRPAIYGGRVAADGTALDPIGFPILDDVTWYPYSGVYRPAVASDGAGFLVAVQMDGQIRGQRVSGAGEVLDPGGFEISAPAIPASPSSLVFGGDQYLVAWSQETSPPSSDSGIYLARVTPDGTVLDPGGVRVFALDSPSWGVAVSFDGANYLLSWVDYTARPEETRLYAARIAPDGTPIDPAPILVSVNTAGAAHELRPVAGFDGTNHVIAWVQAVDPGDDYEEDWIVASRVTPQGELLDPDPIVAYTQQSEGRSVHRLELAAGGGSSVVLWSVDYWVEGEPRGGDIRAARIAADGTVSEHPVPSFTTSLQATLVAHRDGALLLWRHGEAVSGDYTAIVGRRLDAAGMPLPGLVAPASPASRQEVRGVASDGQNFFVLWVDTRDLDAEGKALFGARIAADGTPLDLEPIQLTTHAADLADVVFDGANYLVTWVHYVDSNDDGFPIRAVRVSPAGEVLDAEPLRPRLGPHERGLAGASDGTHTLLVGEAGTVESLLAVMLLDQDGAVASDVVDIVVGDRYDYLFEPAASFDGTGYLVVWHRDGQIFGQMVSAAGALVGQTFPIATGDFIVRLTVGGGGGNHLVVWQDTEWLFATRVSADGQVLDPDGRLITQVQNVCHAYMSCQTADASPAVTFDGKSFVVAWREPAVAGDATSVNVYGAEVSTEGEVLRAFTISEAPDWDGAPFLAAGGVGQVMAAYTRFVPDAPYDTRRARARLLESEVIPAPDAGPPGPGPDAGGSPVDPWPGGDDGCGCRIGADQPAPVAPLLLLGGVVALWLVRRRTAR